MNKLKRTLKTHKWWDSKLALMMALVYYQLFLARVAPPLGSVLLAIALFVVASIGIGGFGHLLNDLYDVEQDNRTGASNLIGKHQPGRTAIRFGIVLLLSWLPWIALPTNASIWFLLVLEYALFLAYSIPPVRLKDRGFLGAVADAMYAYTIPLTCSLLVFARLAHVAAQVWFVALMIAWTLLIGLRGILTHQLEDVSRDQLSSTKTFVTIHGWQKTFALLERVLLPLEAIAFAMFLVALSRSIPWLAIGFAVYLCVSVVKQTNGGIWHVANPWKLPPIDKLFFLTLTVMSRFLTDWLPVLILAALVVKHPSFITLFVIHMVLFNNGIKTLLQYELPAFHRRRQLA